MFFNNKKNIEIPFFPERIFEKINYISVWRFEKNFSQSSYGKHADKGTNSCTLITLLTAELIAREKVETVARSHNIPRDLIKLFAMAILEGNATYARLYEEGKLTNVNLNIPEAMNALQNLLRNIQEWFYVHVNIDDERNYSRVAMQKLSTVIRDGINMWNIVEFNKEYLFVIMIADSRSILLCYDKKTETVSLFDSHNHSSKHGALIAQSSLPDLDNLISWIIEMFRIVYKSQPDVYELSFLPLKNSTI